VVTSIRPYRTRDDVQELVDRAAIIRSDRDGIQARRFCGVGEVHIYGDAAQRPVIRFIMVQTRRLRV